MANSRISGGGAVSTLGAVAASPAIGVLALAGIGIGLCLATPAQAAAQRPIILTADPIPSAPPATVLPTAKHPSPPTHAQTRPLIPPASQLSVPPTPCEPLPLETELLPLASPSDPSPSTRQPAS